MKPVFMQNIISLGSEISVQIQNDKPDPGKFSLTDSISVLNKRMEGVSDTTEGFLLKEEDQEELYREKRNSIQILRFITLLGCDHFFFNRDPARFPVLFVS